MLLSNVPEEVLFPVVEKHLSAIEENISNKIMELVNFCNSGDVNDNMDAIRVKAYSIACLFADRIQVWNRMVELSSHEFEQPSILKEIGGSLTPSMAEWIQIQAFKIAEARYDDDKLYIPFEDELLEANVEWTKS